MFDKFTEWKLAFSDIIDPSPSVFSQYLDKRAAKETLIRLKAVHAGVNRCKLELRSLHAHLEAKQLEASDHKIVGNPASTAKEVNLYFAEEVRKNLQRYHDLTGQQGNPVARHHALSLDRNKENIGVSGA